MARRNVRLLSHRDRDGGSKSVTIGSICVPNKKSESSRKELSGFCVCLFECNRVEKRMKFRKLEPPGTLIHPQYLSNMTQVCYLIKEKSYGNIKVSKIVKKWLEEH